MSINMEVLAVVGMITSIATTTLMNTNMTIKKMDLVAAMDLMKIPPTHLAAVVAVLRVRLNAAHNKLLQMW